MANKIMWSVFLIMVILTSSIYFMMPDKVRIDIQKTKTLYSVWENEKWVLAATEYVNLYDGTTKMRAKSRELTYWNDTGHVYARRTAIWKDDIQTIQTYIFDKDASDIQDFPIENKFECFNCSGKIVHYEIRDILYDGETKIIESPFSFGHNMKIEWQEGSYYSKVFQQKVTSDKIIIKYKPKSDYEKFEVRLFDPWTVNLSTGLNAYYNFDESSGDLINLVGGAWNGTVTSITAREIANQGSPTGINRGYNFGGAGSNDKIDIQNNASGKAPVGSPKGTASFWFNSSYDSDGIGTFHALAGTDGELFSFVDMDTNTVRLYIGGTLVVNVGAPGWWSAGDWVNMVVTWNDSNNNVTIFINDTIKYSSVGVGFTGTTSTNLDIGDMRGLSREWDGVISEVGFWNRILNSSEISDLYNNGDGISYEDTTIEVKLNSTTNLTTEPIIGFCKGFNIDLRNLSYSYEFFRDGVSFSKGNTLPDNFTSGLEINVANISAVNLTTRNNWTLGCISYDGIVNSSQFNSTGLIINTPIFINITYPLNLSNHSVNDIEVNYTYENLTASDSCWWTKDSGAVNTTISCGVNITGQTWSEGSNTIIIYGNDTSGFEFGALVIFNIDTLFPLVEYSDEFNFEGWLNFSNVTVAVIINETLLSNITFRLFNLTDTVNITIKTLITEETLTYFNLSNTNYTLNVTVVDFFNRQNTTENRLFQVDNVFPLINFTSNSDVSNISANFTNKDNIFVNVTVVELNEANITFSLYTSLGIVNQTVFTDKTRTINWTNLAINMYFWNVSITDLGNNINTTAERTYGIIIVNATVQNQSGNLDIELGTNITVNATNTFDIVCIDINHPSFGVNISCANQNNFFSFIIDNFRKSNLIGNVPSTVLNYSGFQTLFFNISAHQYDIVDNLSINMSGTNEPIDPTFFKSNTTSVDRAYDGILMGKTIFLNATTTGEGFANLSYANPGNSSIFFNIDDNANFINFTLDITGITQGLNLTDNFDNFSGIDKDLSNSQLDLSGVIMNQNTSIQEFVFDDFEDSSIADYWIKSDDFNILGGKYIGTITETGGEILITQTFNDISSSSFGSGFMIFEPNFSNLNLFTSDDINLSVINEYDSRADNEGCEGNGYLDVGGTRAWTSFFEPDNGVGGDDIETSRANVSFILDKNNKTSWRVQISGIETTSVFHSVGGGGCGSINTVYNWTNGTFQTTKSDCADTNGILDNDFFITVNYFNDKAFTVWNALSASTECQDIDLITKIENVNRTLWFRDNSTVISNSVLDIGLDITQATFNMTGFIPDNETTSTFLSADNGNNWEGVSLGVLHTFDNTGTNLRWKVDFNTTVPGYANETTRIEGVVVTVPPGAPSNLTFDFGDDGIIEKYLGGIINETNGTISISIEDFNLTNTFNGTPDTGDHSYQVALVVGTASIGQLNLDNFNLTYDPNPVILNFTAIQDFLDTFGANETNFTIPTQATNGSINISAVNYDYAGGNYTYEVLVHNTNYSQNISFNLTYFFTQWDYAFGPAGVNFLEFIPSTPTSNNVSAFGQSTNTNILNITNLGYGGRNANLSILINDTSPSNCVNLTISTNSTQGDGLIMNTTFKEISSDISYLGVTQIWMWADYECNFSTWKLFNPSLFIRNCGNATVCSSEVV